MRLVTVGSLDVPDYVGTFVCPVGFDIGPIQSPERGTYISVVLV